MEMKDRTTPKTSEAQTKRVGAGAACPASQPSEVASSQGPGMKISWDVFRALGREDRRNKYITLWVNSRPDDFWPDKVDYMTKRQEGQAVWEKLSKKAKGNDLEFDIKRWYKAGITVRNKNQGRKPKAGVSKSRFNTLDALAGCRTYKIPFPRHCFRVNTAAAKLRKLDPESLAFEEEMEKLREHPLVRKELLAFKAWNNDITELFGVTESTGAGELSLKADEQHGVTLHVHAIDSMLKRNKGLPSNQNYRIKYSAAEAWKYKGCLPDFSTHQPSGKKMNQNSIEDLHYYGQMKKTGYLMIWTNFAVRDEFPGRWRMLQHQLQKGKITVRQARDEVTENGEGVTSALRFLKELQDARQELAMRKRYLHIRKLVAKHMKPWKPIDMEFTHVFLHHFPPLRALDGTLKRFPLLVYLGPSQTAKTIRMRDFFGPEKTLVVNCKNTLHPNLTQYKDQDAIVWDEASAEFVLVNRGLVQSGIEGCQIQSSPTQRDARWVFLYGVAQMVTTNSWPDYADLPEGDADWLRKNCLVRRISEPLYEE